MKKLIIILTLVIAWQGTNAQQHKEELHWYTDFEQAKAIAKKEHKPIVMLFTGSDWCPPCKAMHNELFVNKDFIKLAKNVVLVMVDFPRRKPISAEQRQKNATLQRKFHRGGVPTMVAVNADEKVLEKIVGYRFGSAQRHLDFIKKVIAANKKG